VKKRKVCLLGSTGSIGVNTLDVVKRFPERFEIHSLAAGSNARLLARQAQETCAKRIALFDPNKINDLKAALNGWHGEILSGESGLRELAEDPNAPVTVSAIVGAAGLLPTLAALNKGKVVAIANKEPLVMAGPLMLEAAERNGATILPIDSEHSAVFQSARSGGPREIRKVILTASGGPFRTASAEVMARSTKREALNHPTWNMGAKITVDSATLMNKALEIIEAHFLFGVPYEAIEVWIHPQSIVHALVEFTDGAVVGQLGLPDMRLPIQYALSHPERWDGGLPPLTLDRMRSLTFEPPDRNRFPTLGYAYKAGKAGGTAPAALNAANEEAVKLFLEDKILFAGIFKAVGEALDAHVVRPLSDLEVVLTADKETREFVRRKFG
jgi:1-deoxy-D-xylulose-5-phosphate reductoisomerase